MPFLFLSPSTQEFNLYVTEGNEEYWMNELADAMEPLLRASGINVTRNDPSRTVSHSIRMSNAGTYGAHLALHSNAAPASLAGRLRGIDLYYYPGRTEARRLADLLRENLEVVYPLPDQVRAVTTTSLAEVRETRAPSVLAELGYHDNIEDARWVQNNLQEIARALTLSVCEFFGLPFQLPQQERPAIATQSSGNLNLRDGPGVEYPVLAKIPSGSSLMALNSVGSWYIVEYNGLIGFASDAYVSVF